MTQLAAVWDEIGIAGEQRAARRGVVLVHVSNLLEEMIREERALRDRLADSVKRLGVELMQLCTELALPLYEVSHGNEYTFVLLSRQRMERNENLMLRWMCGVTLKDKVPTVELRKDSELRVWWRL